MKAMKGMNMNRMLGSFKRKTRAPSDNGGGSSIASPGGFVDSGLDTPEANAARNVRLFCESAGPNGGGDEVLYLPTIVESCESSPSAAKEAAYSIRKFLSKDNFSKPYVQYNSIMLIRILADNPGKTFTRNVDLKFVQTVKELLRNGRDPSVKQILMETLDTFQQQKQDDEGLAPLLEMWKKEHERMVKIHGPAGPRAMNAPAHDPHQNYFSRNHHSRRLPAPHELVARIEESKNSAQLLSQTCQSTPPSELLQDELVREFANRCQSASRSIQAYMVAENPAPDNDTMETLIETNELLTKAMNAHQRAVLNARKATGANGGTVTQVDSGFAAPPAPPPTLMNPPMPPRKAATGPPIPPPGDFAPMGEDENPFADPADRNKSKKSADMSRSDHPVNSNMGIEPWHPGFKETTSYVGRQDSSVGNVTMHAAADEPSPVSPPQTNGQPEAYGTRSNTNAPIYRY